MIDPELKNVLSQIDILEQLCDVVRLVDPVMKRVVSCQRNTEVTLNSNCFDFWGKNQMCDNCISMRTFYEHKTYFKIEYNAEHIYLVTAIPFDLPDRVVVIEMLTDTTDSMLFATGGDAASKQTELYTLIDSMNHIALKDALTGAHNRRYVEEKLPIDLMNCALLSQDMSVIMMDIDYFKQVNDTYGHMAGDCALKSIVEVILKCIKRGSDWIARFGGDEFLICLPGANQQRVKALAEQMRSSVATKDILCGETSLHITASFGVCTVAARLTDSVDQVLRVADEKLYLAKRNGRNRVEWA